MWIVVDGWADGKFQVPKLKYQTPNPKRENSAC